MIVKFEKMLLRTAGGIRHAPWKLPTIEVGCCREIPAAGVAGPARLQGSYPELRQRREQILITNTDAI